MTLTLGKEGLSQLWGHRFCFPCLVVLPLALGWSPLHGSRFLYGHWNLQKDRPLPLSQFPVWKSRFLPECASVYSWLVF